jgi:hypothetical protein
VVTPALLDTRQNERAGANSVTVHSNVGIPGWVRRRGPPR